MVLSKAILLRLLPGLARILQRRYVMAEPQRVPKDEVQKAMKSGKAILACAYEDDEKCKQMPIEGAIPFSSLKSKLPSLSKDQEIILYCG
jgi:hypothetical protein